MNTHLEMVLRLVGLFISVYFTTKWTVKSDHTFDTLLAYTVVTMAIFMNDTNRM